MPRLVNCLSRASVSPTARLGMRRTEVTSETGGRQLRELQSCADSTTRLLAALGRGRKGRGRAHLLSRHWPRPPSPGSSCKGQPRSFLFLSEQEASAGCSAMVRAEESGAIRALLGSETRVGGAG